MKTLLVVSLMLCSAASAAVPPSINNDDSCDIKVGPAATLLLPYFEVNTNPNVPGQTTLFTITNVTRYPQIAHVTLWTDWAYPVMTFNLFLTGYDIQAINLADVLIRGSAAPPSGSSQTTRPGTLSAGGNPNLRSPLDCTDTPVIRFDEHENPFAFLASPICVPCMGPFVPPLPATSSTNGASSLYPNLTGPDVAGWLYLNLNNGGTNAYSVTYRSTGTATSAPTAFGTPRASQNWVTVAMFGNGGTSHMTAELDAAPFGNGCSPAAAISGGVISGPRFGPAGGVFVCPPGTTLTNGTTTLCTGTNANPIP